MNLKIYVANWKMNMHLDDAKDFAIRCKDFIEESKKSARKIILCPSFPALASVAQVIDSQTIGLGAQNCSEHEVGAFTGEVSAQSLYEVGCNYCIVGHSERRRYFHETNEIIARKVTKLLQANLNPIICVGETAQEFKDEHTLKILEQQLQPVIKAINEIEKNVNTICFAYEPIWAIGTGKVPTPEVLQHVFSWLTSYVAQEITRVHPVYLLYGGSVDEKNIDLLNNCSNIDGYLIGSASLDFQKFKNIVSLL